MSHFASTDFDDAFERQTSPGPASENQARVDEREQLSLGTESPLGGLAIAGVDDDVILREAEGAGTLYRLSGCAAAVLGHYVDRNKLYLRADCRTMRDFADRHLLLGQTRASYERLRRAGAAAWMYYRNESTGFVLLLSQTGDLNKGCLHLRLELPPLSHLADLPRALRAIDPARREEVVAAVKAGETPREAVRRLVPSTAPSSQATLDNAVDEANAPSDDGAPAPRSPAGRRHRSVHSPLRTMTLDQDESYELRNLLEGVRDFARDPRCRKRLLRGLVDIFDGELRIADQ